MPDTNGDTQPQEPNGSSDSSLKSRRARPLANLFPKKSNGTDGSMEDAEKQPSLLSRALRWLAITIGVPILIVVLVVWWLIARSRVIAVAEFLCAIGLYFKSANNGPFSSSDFFRAEDRGGFSGQMIDMIVIMGARAISVFWIVSMFRYRSPTRRLIVAVLSAFVIAYTAAKIKLFGWDSYETDPSTVQWALDNKARAHSMFVIAIVFSALYLLGEIWVPTSLSQLIASEKAVLDARPEEFRSRVRTISCKRSGISYIFAAKKGTPQDQIPSASDHQHQHCSLKAAQSQQSVQRAREPNAPVIVLIHGFGAGKTIFMNEIESLSEHFDVYALDWLGAGASARPHFTATTVEATEKFFIDSIETWRSELGLGKFVLCGHSFGGYLGACYALSHPEHVAHLVMASPVGVPEASSRRGPSRIPVLIRYLFQAIWTMNLAPQSVLRFFGPIGPFVLRKALLWRFHQVDVPNMDLMVNYLYHANAGPPSGERALTRILQFGLFAREPLSLRLPALSPSVPATFLYGMYDWMDVSAGSQAAVAMRSAGKTAKVYRVPEAGHQLFLENPKAMAAALAAILRNQPVDLPI